MIHSAVRPRHAIRWLACGLMLFQTMMPIAAVRGDGLAGVSGGTVVAGQAAIATDGSTLNVNTMTDRTIINWNGFSIGAGETANFFQPGSNSAVLNRVTTPNNPSAIFGAMNSNGNVILVNPSGIVVGAGGVINTNGFTASVLDIPNNEFLQGGVLNFRGNSTASVINEGTIKTGTGGAALIGGNVINNGSITSEGGSISLATGGSVTLADGSRFTHADMATIESGISPTAGLIQNSGTIRATGAMETGGEVFLVNPGGKIMHDGTIAAYRSKPGGQTGGDVMIAAKGGTAEVGGAIDVSGQTGGSVTVEAENIQVAGATIDASGINGGGNVNVGGGFQGNDASIANAKTTSVDAESTINADAIENGDGGQVVVWSDEATEFYAAITSTGGSQGGNGGLVEVSGAALAFDGTVDTSAAMGSAGWLLLDPVGIRIVRGDLAPTMPGTDPVLTLTDGTLNSVLQTTNVLLATSPSNTNVVRDPGGADQGRGNTGANDDNIVVSAGTFLDTGEKTLFFSTSTVDLYADIAGNVAGGVASGTELEGFAIKDPTVVNVYDAGSTTGSIQNAVDIVGSGGTINVGDGTFAGGIVIDKTLSLLGDGSTNTSLIEVASNSAGMTVTGNNVLIDGFRFDAESGAVNTTAIQLGQGFFQPAEDATIRDVAVRDLTHGIVGNRVTGSLTISDVDMRRIDEQGIVIQSPLFGGNVLIEDANIVSEGEAVLFENSLNGTVATIRSSRLVSNGTDAVSFAGDINTFSSVMIGGTASSDANRIAGNDDGIDIDGNVSLFSQVQIAGNTRIVGGDDAIDVDGDLFLSSLVVSDNGLIRGDDDAINFDGTHLLSEVAVTNNQDIRSSDDGISFANLFLSRVELSDNSLRLGTTGTGLSVSYSGNSELGLGTGNSFDGGVDGIVINGSGGATLNVVGNTINDTAFSNQSGDYIRLEDTALFAPGNPTIIDAKDATFEGLKGIEMSATQLFATEDKMVHFPDDNTLGLFDISELFVVQGESIQLAVNAAGALGGAQEVVVGAGTFGGSVEVWVDNLTMTGTGATTIIDTDQVDAFANNGDRDTGFELTNTSPIATPGSEVNNVTIDGFSFAGSGGGTTGILLGEGGRRADDTTIKNSFFDGLTDGIAVRNIDDGLTISNVRMRNISQQGIDIRTNLGGDEIVLIEDSNICSDREAILFDGSLNGSEVVIRSNRLTSRDRDGVRFAETVRSRSDVLIADNRIRGEDEGIDFDGNITASSVRIVRNRSIEGSDDGIAVDGLIFLSEVKIANNGEIIGASDGINLESVILSRIDVNRNELIEGRSGSGIEFDGLMAAADVQVADNESVVGEEYGIEFDEGIVASQIRIADNDRIRGEDVAGISFRFGVADSDLRVVNNDRIRGGENGVEFHDSVGESTVRIARTESIRGDSNAGIRFDADIDDSLIRIVDNNSIVGDLFGIDLDNPITESRVRIADNGLIVGEITTGIRFDASIEDSAVRILDNQDVLGRVYGIDVDGGVEQSVVQIEGNNRIRGTTFIGIAFQEPIEDSDVLIRGNDRVRGRDHGIWLQRIDDSYVEISGNGAVFGDEITGISFETDVIDSEVKIAQNDLIEGGEYGIRFRSEVTDSTVKIKRNDEITGATDAGIAFLGDLDNTTVKIKKNDVFSDEGDGVLFDGLVTDSKVRIKRNQVEADNEAVQFEDDIVDSDVKIKRNTLLAGGAGVAFSDRSVADPVITDSTIVISKNVIDALNGDSPSFGIIFEGIDGDSTVTVKKNEVVSATEDGLLLQDFIRDDAFLNIFKNKIGSKNNPVGQNGLDIDEVSSSRGIRIAKNKIFGDADAIEFDDRIINSIVEIVDNKLIGTNGDGIAFQDRIRGDSVVNVSGNKIKAGQNGISTESVRNSSKLSLIDNVIVTTGNGSGILLRNLDSSEAALVQGGSTTGGAFGLRVTQEGGAARDGKVIVDGLFVHQASDTGIEFKTEGANKTLEVSLRNGVRVYGGVSPAEVGMVFDGLGLSLTGNTLADTHFVNTPGNFIELRNGALFAPGSPTLIDGTGVYWDGLSPAIDGQRQQIIDRIVDFLDDQTLGLIFPGAGLPDEQTYDRFTRYDDYFRTIDSLMGPYAAGSITYPTPREEIAENLGDDSADDDDGGDEESQAADTSAEPAPAELAASL